MYHNGFIVLHIFHPYLFAMTSLSRLKLDGLGIIEGSIMSKKTYSIVICVFLDLGSNLW